VKGKAVLVGLAATGILALSATVAQAGAGGSPTLLTGFFVCHATEGSAPEQEFDVESPAFGPVDGLGNLVRQKIKLGKAALACAFAKLFPRPTQEDPDPVAIEPLPEGTSPDQMKCFPVSNSQKPKASPPAEYTATDVLVGEENVLVPSSSLKFLCAPATFFSSVPSD
jgi:hypothetical protein